MTLVLPEERPLSGCGTVQTRPRAGAVSFVIPVRNDAQGLARCIASIREASHRIDRTEIIVVDNGSSDGSADVARRAGCVVLVTPGERVASLRNRGAARASGEWLVFVDADHELAPTWLTSALELFADASVSAAGAPYSSPPASTWVQRAYDALRDHTAGRRPVEWLASGNLAVRGSVFMAIGGFDSSLEACEDVDLCRRVRDSGGVLLTDERLRSIHHGDPGTLGQLFASELWRGRNNLQVSLREPLTIRSVVSLAIPIYQLGTLLACLVATAAGAFGFAAAALAAFVIPSAARIVMMRRRASLPLTETAAVAIVFDTARALALLIRKRHRRVKPGDDPGQR